jgi:mannose-6-phosphate isomerase-like protein (cupin superfamily)
MADGYDHTTLDELEPIPGKPSDRWDVSGALGISDYNYNVAVLAPGERLSRTGYHAHPEQREFYHVVDGRCRVEVEDGSFDLDADGVVHFEAGVPHMLHNPFEEPCTLVAVGSPPEAHHPVEQVQSAEAFFAERYPEP